MHNNNKLSEQVITNITYTHIKPIEHQKQIKLIITPNLKPRIFTNNRNSPKTFLNQTKVVYTFTCPFPECLSENNITANIYIGHTTTTLSRRFTYHLSP